MDGHLGDESLHLRQLKVNQGLVELAFNQSFWAHLALASYQGIAAVGFQAQFDGLVVAVLASGQSGNHGVVAVMKALRPVSSEAKPVAEAVRLLMA